MSSQSEVPFEVMEGSVHTGMNYASTTQTLFALIIMTIILLFILVYCCWGSFNCSHHRHDAQTNEEEATLRDQPQDIRAGSRVVIVPFSSRIYIGDPHTRQIYQIPVTRSKPPAYSESLISMGPPPPYYPTSRQHGQTPPSYLSDRPPSYDDCLTAPYLPDSAWHVMSGAQNNDKDHPPPICVAFPEEESVSSSATHQQQSYSTQQASPPPDLSSQEDYEEREPVPREDGSFIRKECGPVLEEGNCPIPREENSFTSTENCNIVINRSESNNISREESNTINEATPSNPLERTRRCRSQIRLKNKSSSR